MPSTKERARGRWREILPRLGISERFLTGKNCPCPVCGGTDRFRYLERKGQDGDGMWLCNRCEPHPKPAIALAIKFTGKPFRETARAIDDILGDRHVILPQTPIRLPEDDGSKSVQYRKAWRRGVPVKRGDIVDRYLRNRSVGLDIYAPCLRTSELDWYLETHPDYLPEPEHIIGDYYRTYTEVMHRVPAMFAAVTNPDGKHIATHRTFLDPDGNGKANVSKPRKVAGKFGKGPTIRLSPAAPTMGIAEGIETALSATKLFRVPTWSVICAYGIETFQPPPECRHLIIFADNDAHGRGLEAAQKLCQRLTIPTSIEMPERMPEKPKTDWNDVLMESVQ